MPKSKKHTAATHRQTPYIRKQQHHKGAHASKSIAEVRLKAAANALIQSAGCINVSQLLEETGAELLEKGINKPSKKQAIRNDTLQQDDSASAMEQQQAAVEAEPLPAAADSGSSLACQPSVAPPAPQPDINSLLSSWSVREGPSEAVANML